MDAKNHKDLGGIRREYRLERLEETQLPEDPMVLFHQWLDQARKTENPEPTAMTLSTVDQDGNPSSRIVLLKKMVAGQLWFFTNYESRKAKEMGCTFWGHHSYYGQEEQVVNDISAFIKANL